MKMLFIALPFLLHFVESSVLTRANSQQDYINSVCSPNATAPPLPPCISVVNIEQRCEPNGTRPIDYQAHAMCMCSAPSSFFADRKGCENCQFIHGSRTEQDFNKAIAIIDSVSQALCSGTPTAKFADLYSTLAYKVTASLSGATGASDRYPSQTAVSLYYTASGVQGYGLIAGNATMATKSANSASATGLSVSSGSKNAGATAGASTILPSAPKSAGVSASVVAKSSAFAVYEARPGWAMTVAGGVIFAISL